MKLYFFNFFDHQTIVVASTEARAKAGLNSEELRLLATDNYKSVTIHAIHEGATVVHHMGQLSVPVNRANYLG